MIKSSYYRTIVLILVGLTSIGILCGCRNKQESKLTLSVWAQIAPFAKQGNDAAIAEFERRHPNIHVQLLNMGAGGMNPQKLMTAIVGNAPPDVILQDRFQVGDWASRGTFMPLDNLIARDRNKPNGIRPEEYYKAAWGEVVYDGKVYAIPREIDDRILFYNRQTFREAGLDPDRPPRTWDELLEYSKKLTVRRPDGGFKRMGFIPNCGNSYFYLYSWQNDGEFMSPDGRKCTLNNPKSLAAMKYLVGFYDQLGGYEAVNTFSSGFKTDELDPFLVGQVPMIIQCSNYLSSIARYNPSIDFGVAPPPVPTARYEGKPPFSGEPKYVTWSGGFAWVIPRGAKHVDEAWEFIKWMNSEEGVCVIDKAQQEYNQSRGRPFDPDMIANTRINLVVDKKFGPKVPRFRKGKELCISMLSSSRFRPVTFVGQRLWDEHSRAFDLSISHKKSPEQALDDGSQAVQRELDKVAERQTYPLLDWKWPFAIIAVCVLTLIVVAVGRVRRLGSMAKLSRRENAAGYLFASPWIIGFLIFGLGPIVASAVLSFCDYDVLHPALWVGMKNYQDLLGSDWYFMSKTLYNVGFLALFSIPLNMMVSLGIAMLLNTKVSGMKWYRTFFYLPSIMPIVANAILWLWVLNPEYGLVNTLWKATLTPLLHLPAPHWMASEYSSKPALVVMGLWGAGSGMILWLAGLQGVPRPLYESAEIDGAGWWARLRNITLPMLTPYIFFNLIMGIIGTIQTFDTVYVMTSDPNGGVGGPVDSTLVPVVYLFRCAFSYFKMGYASAIAWLIFVAVLLLTLVQLKLANRWVYYENERGK